MSNDISDIKLEETIKYKMEHIYLFNAKLKKKVKKGKKIVLKKNNV